MYQYKEKYIIDFTEVQHYLEMHHIIRQALDWPDYYGCNWSAFWDCLTCDSPVSFVEIRGEKTVAEELRPMVEALHSLLDEAKEKGANEGWAFDYKVTD